MTFLELILWLSLALAVAALAVMAGLVLGRLVTAWRSMKWQARRSQLVVTLLSGQSLSAEDLSKLPAALLAETFIELIALVRGDERDDFVKKAVALGVPQHFERQLRHGTARERVLAAQALSQFGGTETHLRRALSDRSPDVRLAAALSLAARGDTQNVAELVAHLRRNAKEDSRLAVTLFRHLSVDYADEIRQILVDPEIPSPMRLAALDALVKTGDYSLVPLIAKMVLEAPAGAVELPDYLRALGALAHPAARPAVLHGLYHSTAGIRAEAAAAAGRIGLTELAEPLVELLDDTDWWVRFRAGEALIMLGETGLRLLRLQAQHGPGRARTAAASLLAEHRTAA